MKTKRVMAIAFMVSIFIFAGFCGFVFFHEQVHVQINTHYGIESKVNYGLFVATTTGDKPCPNDTCIMLHNLNEIVSYPMQMFFAVNSILLGCILIIQIIRLEMEAERNQNLKWLRLANI